MRQGGDRVHESGQGGVRGDRCRLVCLCNGEVVGWERVGNRRGWDGRVLDGPAVGVADGGQGGARWM